VTLIKLTLVAVIGLTPVFYSAKVMAKGKEGAACKVVGGANKGKKGTYDADGDCAGSWGMTAVVQTPENVRTRVKGCPREQELSTAVASSKQAPSSSRKCKFLHAVSNTERILFGRKHLNRVRRQIES
jgi:hypothetical protein